jgi:GH3 auxin-responsive promoter
MGKLVWFIFNQQPHMHAYSLHSPGRNPAQALVIVQGKLQTDAAYKNYCDDSYAGDPTIRILKPGTFKEYRQWKGDTRGISSGQIKVPTMITDSDTIDWLAERVVLEV